MQEIDYRKPEDLLIVDAMVADLGQMDKIYFGTMIATHDITPMPFYLRWALKWRARRERQNPMVVLMAMFQRYPAMLDWLIDKFRKHLIYGKDKYSTDAAGGFDRFELNVIVGSLTHLSEKIDENNS